MTDDAIATVTIDTEGSGDSWLVLTPIRVIAHLDRSFLGKTETSVPIQAIDSVVLGWRREIWLGVIALVLLAFAITFRGAAAMFLAMAVVCGLAFWFYRPAQILVRSGKESLGGKPKSWPEAEQFVRLLTEVLSAAEPPS